MEEKIYRIKFARCAPTRNWQKEIPEGYYGPVPGVTMNHAIYSRVPRDKAYIMNKRDALYNIQQFLGSGYEAHCEPPITIVY